jgi:putative transcriptional regulator
LQFFTSFKSGNPCATAGEFYRSGVREFASSSISLAGSLLIAHPSLIDPNFRRSVLFISGNDPQDGSFGLIINRPTGRTVGELVSEKEFGALGRIPVFLGGPVATDQLVFASFRWHPETERMECRPHLVVDEAEQLVQEEAVIVRAFVGYAGWTRGQLEGELAQKAWLVQVARPESLEVDRCPTLWREITSSFGPWFKLLAEAPEEGGQN